MTHWLDEITIHRFRGLQELTLTGLGSVNILVGVNNSGKTSILEALSLYARPFDLYEWTSTAWRREVKSSRRSTVEALKWLFPQNPASETEDNPDAIHVSSQGKYPVTDVTARFEEITRLMQKTTPTGLYITEEGETEAGAKVSIRLQKTSPDAEVQEKSFEIWDTQNRPYPKSSRPSLPVATVTPVTHRIEQLTGISDLIKSKNKADILQSLTLFDPGVRDITILTPQGMRPTIEIDHVDFKTTVPVSAFGDGMRRTLTFALTIPKVKNGLLLVDEIETAIHVSALQEVYSWLVKICQRNAIQLFVTTHSLEAVDALLNTHSEPYEGLVTFSLSPGAQPVKRLSGELLNRLRNERGLDVR